MNDEVIFMTTAEVRTKTRELVREIAQKSDQEVITLNAGSIKDLVKLMRDYAIITHATPPETEAAAAVESLINYVDANESAVPLEVPGYYKTTQLADIFGVSVTAINNWIDEDRFIDFRREPHKHARIPHFTMFRHRDGRIEPLGLVVERYRRQENTSFADDDERAMLLAEIDELMRKYGGKAYEEAFEFATLTPAQERDASRWRFFRMRLNSLS